MEDGNNHSKTKSTAGWLQSNLFAVRGQQVEAAGRNGEADRHSSKLQVTLPQDGRHAARGRLARREMWSMRDALGKNGQHVDSHTHSFFIHKPRRGPEYPGCAGHVGVCVEMPVRVGVKEQLQL